MLGRTIASSRELIGSVSVSWSVGQTAPGTGSKLRRIGRITSGNAVHICCALRRPQLQAPSLGSCPRKSGEHEAALVAFYALAALRAAISYCVVGAENGVGTKNPTVNMRQFCTHPPGKRNLGRPAASSKTTRAFVEASALGVARLPRVRIPDTN